MHVTLKVNTNVNTKVNSEWSCLVVDAGLPIGSRLQSLPQRSDLIDLTSGTTGGSHPLGPKLWNL